VSDAGVLGAIRRVNRTTRPEDSIPLRSAILASVVVGVLAVLVSGAAPIADAVGAIVLLPLGAWVSWRRRTGDNLGIKVALTVGAGLALWRFFGDLGGAVNLDDTRAPLASLFLAVQVLHGFDLPQRRDLGFTLASSLALVALAATSTHSGLFGLLLLVYVALAAVSLAGIQRSAARERADVVRADTLGHPLRGGDPEARHPAGRPRGASSAWTDAPGVRGLADSGSGLLRAAGPVMLVGALVFLLLPRTGPAQIGTLPFRGFPGSSSRTASSTTPGWRATASRRPATAGANRWPSIRPPTSASPSTSTCGPPGSWTTPRSCGSAPNDPASGAAWSSTPTTGPAGRVAGRSRCRPTANRCVCARRTCRRPSRPSRSGWSWTTPGTGGHGSSRRWSY